MTRLFNLAAGMGLPSARYARFGQAHTGDLQKRRYTTEDTAGVLNPETHRWETAWQQERPNLTAFLRKQVFIRGDQFVVPSLNLKSAQRVLCRNERQKKVLRRMGFIEDRIEIRNMPRH